MSRANPVPNQIFQGNAGALISGGYDSSADYKTSEQEEKLKKQKEYKEYLDM